MFEISDDLRRRLQNLPTDASWFLRGMTSSGKNPSHVTYIEPNVAESVRDAIAYQNAIGHPKGRGYATTYATDKEVNHPLALPEGNAGKRTLGQFSYDLVDDKGLPSPDGQYIRVRDDYNIDLPKAATDAALKASREYRDAAWKKGDWGGVLGNQLSVAQHHAVNALRDKQELDPASIPKVDAMIPLDPQYPGHTLMTQWGHQMRQGREGFKDGWNKILGKPESNTQEVPVPALPVEAPPSGNFITRSLEGLNNFLGGMGGKDAPDTPPVVTAPAPDTPPVVTAPASSYGSYEVQAGENLTNIARQHGMTLEELLALNKEISNPNLIPVGYGLKVATR